MRALNAKGSIVLALGAITLGAVVASGSIPSDLWLLIGCSAMLALFPFARGLGGRFDIFEPTVLFGISYLVLFVLRPVFDVAASTPLRWIGYSLDATYSEALLVGCVGALAFYAGYFSPISKRVGNGIGVPKGSWSRSSLTGLVLVVCAVSVTLYSLFLVTNGGFSIFSALLSGRNPTSETAIFESSGYLYTAPLWVAPLGVLVLALSRRWMSAQGVAGFALLFYSQILTLFRGDRSWIVPVVLAVIVVWYLRQGRRPRVVTALCGVVAVFLIGISVPAAYRYTLDRSGSLADVVGSTLTNPAKAAVRFFTGADTAMVDDLAIEIQFVPSSVHYQYGGTYLEALTRPIPRALWKEKPGSADSLLMQAIWPDFARSNVGFSFSGFGEPYLNFGLAGVVVFSLMFGGLSRALYVWLQRDPLNAVVAAGYAVSLPFIFIYLRGGLGADYQREIIMSFPLVVATAVALIRRKAGAGSSSWEQFSIRRPSDAEAVRSAVTPQSSL